MAKTDIYYIEALGKALDVLDIFAESDKPLLSLQEVALLSKLNKNAVFRILHTLSEHGYVVKRGQEYELGSKLHALSNRRLRRKDLLSVCGPFMDALRTQFGETVNLGVLDGLQIRYVDVRESHESIRLAERIGASDFLHCTALGKAWLACLPSEEVRRICQDAGMQTRTNRTITTISGLRSELESIRKAGYAVDNEESMTGAFCVGVAILNDKSRPVAAMSVSGPTVRFTPASERAVSQALLKAASEIRATLGYR